METLKSQLDIPVIDMSLKKRSRWNKGNILPDNEIIGGIFGSSGSGKTMFLLQIIGGICPQYLKYVIICSRIEGNEVYDAINKWCEKTKKKYHFTSNLDESYSILEDVINNKNNEEQFLVILDDWNLGGITTRENPFTKMSNDLITKSRNYGGNFIFVAQTYSMMSTVGRSNLNMMVVFRMTDKYSRNIMAKDFSSITDKDEKIFHKLHSEIAKIKHSYFIGTSDNIWIYINGQMDKAQKVKIKNNDDDTDDSDDSDDDFD
jgi:Ni2+-binding GTPase involved in maturation of urease and hydrogenase